MTLRARLLLTTLVLSVAITAALALIVRQAWQAAESTRFEREFRSAVDELSLELDDQAADLKARLRPLCSHDAQVDSALVGYQGDTLEARLLPIKLGLEDSRRAQQLSELALVLGNGEVIAGTWSGSATGPVVRSAVQARVEGFEGAPALRPEAPLAFEAACTKRRGEHWVALVASVEVDALLRAAGERHDLTLALHTTAEELDADALAVDQRRLTQTVNLPGLPGKHLQASRSRIPLSAALESADLEVASAALATLALALLMALFTSRGLSRPIVAFAQRTRAALRGSVEPLPVEGGPELEDAARAFNHTLDDLQKLRARLAVTERIAARREVARRVAHEIKNPLTPIRTSIETLRKLKAAEHEEFDTFFDEATQTVLEEVGRITRLVRNFSEYARLPTPNPQSFNLTALCRKLVGFHRELGAEISFEGDHLDVIADSDQLEQVVTNLLKNAVEATASCDTPRVEVRVFVQVGDISADGGRADAGEEGDSNGVGGGLASVEVSDNGAGVDPAMLPRLFEPYVTSKKTGTGLGLPISHRIAVEHGGDLVYRSRPGGGASFLLTIPVDGPPAVLGAALSTETVAQPKSNTPSGKQPLGTEARGR